MKKLFLTLLLVAGSYTIMAQQTVEANGDGGKYYYEECYNYIKGVRSQEGTDIYCKPPYNGNCFVIVTPCPQAKVLSDATILRLPFGKNFVDIPIKSNYKIEKMLDGSTKLSYELE